MCERTEGNNKAVPSGAESERGSQTQIPWGLRGYAEGFGFYSKKQQGASH